MPSPPIGRRNVKGHFAAIALVCNVLFVASQTLAADDVGRAAYWNEKGEL
jgi:hypothetical protein